LAVPGAVAEEELARAKLMLKSSLMQQLNTFSFIAEDIGRQILTYGRRMPALETFARIDAVTLKDVQETAKGFLDPNVKVAVAALGQVDKLPSFDWMNKVMKERKF
jgi:mitochondrial-processing peptidase subunit beta